MERFNFTATQYPNRNRVSKGTKLISSLIKPDDKVLDFGCGNGRNGQWLLDQHDDIVVAFYDPYINLDVKKHADRTVVILDNYELFEDEYDWILCSFVINVLPPVERIIVYADLIAIKSPNLIVEARSVKDIGSAWNESWTPHKDGWITTKNTFQVGITIEDIVSMLNGSQDRKIVTKYKNPPFAFFSNVGIICPMCDKDTGCEYLKDGELETCCGCDDPMERGHECSICLSGIESDIYDLYKEQVLGFK